MKLQSMRFLFTISLSLFSFSMFGQTKTITVGNPSGTARIDELVVFSKSFLRQKLGAVPVNKYLFVKVNNSPKVVQFDDMDGDGKWDEAAFLYSFKPYEKANFTVTISDKPFTVKAMVRAHVRQMHKLPDESFGPSVMTDTMPYNNQPTDFSKHLLPPYLTEGPGWENDKVGFRKYFDVRNANDLWGKTTNKMVLDEVGVDPKVIYHHLDTWGMDILKVGKSLGAGGLALQIKLPNGKDSLVRFGTNVTQTTYQQIADGPIRAIFKIHYKGWKIGTLPPIDATEQISIWGGQYFYENKVTVENAPANAKLVTGTIDFFVKNYSTSDTANASALYTYGVQSENQDNLGLAIVVNKNAFPTFGHTPTENSEVLNTYTVAQKIIKGKPLVYRFYAGWEKFNPRFSTKEGFEAFMKEEMAKMGSGLKM